MNHQTHMTVSLTFGSDVGGSVSLLGRLLEVGVFDTLGKDEGGDEGS